MDAASQTLIQTIQTVAACPCPQHQEAFVDALASIPELLFKVVATNNPPRDGPHEVGPDENVEIELVTADGRTFLLAQPRSRPPPQP